MSVGRRDISKPGTAEAQPTGPSYDATTTIAWPSQLSRQVSGDVGPLRTVGA